MPFNFNNALSGLVNVGGPALYQQQAQQQAQRQAMAALAQYAAMQQQQQGGAGFQAQPPALPGMPPGVPSPGSNPNTTPGGGPVTLVPPGAGGGGPPPQSGMPMAPPGMPQPIGTPQGGQPGVTPYNPPPDLGVLLAGQAFGPGTENNPMAPAGFDINSKRFSLQEREQQQAYIQALRGAQAQQRVDTQQAGATGRTEIVQANMNSRAAKAAATAASKASNVDLGRQLTAYTNTVNNFRNNPQSIKTPEGQQAYQDALDGQAAVQAEFNRRRGAAGLSAPKSAPAAAGGGASPSYTQEDLEYTAKQNNMTVDEVKAKLGIK